MGGGAKEATVFLNEAVDLMHKIRMDDETFEIPFISLDQLFAILEQEFILLSMLNLISR